MAVSTPSFTISLFKNKTDATPREVSETSTQFIKRLSTPAIRASKDGPLWSPAIFKPARRKKENVIELSMLVLDIDGGMTIDQADKTLRKLGALACICTTHSHQRVTPGHPKAQDCFRVVILLADPISADNYPRLWEWGNDLFKGKIDAGCKDASRMYYLPAIASKSAPSVFRNYVGAPLDWAALDLPDDTNDDQQETTIRNPARYYQAAIDGEIDRVWTAPAKGRNIAYNKAVYNLARLNIDRATVEAELIPVAQRIGLDATEIRDTFDSAYNAGASKPKPHAISSGGVSMNANTQTKKSGNGTGARTGHASVNAGAGSGKAPKKNTTRRKKIDPIELALDRVTLFHDSDGRQYATIKRNGHVETRLIGSKDFRLWYKGAFFEASGTPLHGEAFTAALSVLEAMAQFQGAERRVYLRIAEHGENIYSDLCDSSWRVIEITPNDWRVIPSKDSPVLFTRRGGMLALPEPVKGGNLVELRRLINCARSEDDDAWALIVGWLAMCFHPRGPFPILNVGGEQGSAKSTACRMLQRLIDPNAGDLRGVPKEERDLMIAANNCWLMTYDNLSGATQEISDRFCRVSTGAGFGTRTLHTNDEETIFAARSPILANGIADINYPDFLDRCVSVYLRQIPEDERRDEKIIWSEFEAARPRILGALLSGVSHALKNQATVKLPRKPRMADFAIWATAAETGLGLTAGAFMAAYEDNRAAANQVALENSPAIEIREFIDGLTSSDWQGTPKSLLDALDLVLKGKGVDPLTKYNWPKAPNKLTEALRRIAPNLRGVGIDVSFPRTNGKRLITITKKP
jgi:hypothetical protein